MQKLGYTKHGEQRANQRGFRGGDVELIRRCGTPVEDRHADEVYLLRNKDVDREIRARKQEIQRLEGMRGSMVVIINNQLVTVLHTSRSHEKFLLRRAG